MLLVRVGFVASALPGTEAPSRSASRPASSSPPPPRDEKRKKVQAAETAAASRRSKADSSSKGPKSSAKAKGKAKAAAAVVEKEDVDMEDGGKGAADDDGSDPAEDDSGEEDAVERKAASKRCVCTTLRWLLASLPELICSAEVALDRREEMDVPGWKMGDPCVIIALIVRSSRTLMVLWLEYPMRRSQMHSRSSRRRRSG